MYLHSISHSNSKNCFLSVDPEASFNVASAIFLSEQRCKPARVKAGRCRPGKVPGSSRVTGGGSCGLEATTAWEP